MREQSNGNRVSPPPANEQNLSSTGLLYRPSAAAAAAAAALSMAGAFPFGPFGTLSSLGGLRMLANQSSMPFPAGMIGIRPNLSSLLPFGLPGSAGPRPGAYFPYASPSGAFQPQPQPPRPHQPQQQLPSPSPCPGNNNGDRPERGSGTLLPHTPPTSPSLDENTDLNKTGKSSPLFARPFCAVSVF